MMETATGSGAGAGMATWQMLLITLLVAVVLGCIIGVLVGKHQVKKLSGNYKPILSVPERIIFAVCVVAGVVCISLGLFYTPGGEQNIQDGMNPGMQEGMVPGGDMEMNPGEVMPEGEIQPRGEEGEIPESGASESEPPESEAASGETAEGEATDEAAEAAEGEDTEATEDTAVFEAAGNGGTATAEAAPRSAPSVRVRSSGGGGVVVVG